MLLCIYISSVFFPYSRLNICIIFIIMALFLFFKNNRCCKNFIH
eukprot:UN16511